MISKLNYINLKRKGAEHLRLVFSMAYVRGTGKTDPGPATTQNWRESWSGESAREPNRLRHTSVNSGRPRQRNNDVNCPLSTDYSQRQLTYSVRVIVLWLRRMDGKITGTNRTAPKIKKIKNHQPQPWDRWKCVICAQVKWKLLLSNLAFWTAILIRALAIYLNDWFSHVQPRPTKWCTTH